MTKKLYRIIPLLLVLVLVMGIIPANAQDDPIVVTWFIGLGTGNDPLQIPVEEAVVAAWNDSHDDIKIEMIIAPTFEDGRNMMSTLMATGDAPDIVGPIGFGGSNDYKDNWLDLQPLVDSSGYDLSQFPQGAVDAQRTEDGLLGLPLASFPTFLWYRPALFDEAGLEYPPAAYGEPYILDGEEVEWNLETLREVGMILTVDANGYDATEAEFDPENTIQWATTTNVWTVASMVPCAVAAQCMKHSKMAPTMLSSPITGLTAGRGIITVCGKITLSPPMPKMAVTCWPPVMLSPPVIWQCHKHICGTFAAWKIPNGMLLPYRATMA